MPDLTDAELLAYCGFKPEESDLAAKFLSAIKPSQRRMINRMHDLETAINLWQAGKGPRPTGAILCFPCDGHDD